MKIKRARGHRLYTHKGEKILDLSMDSGRAVLGHRPNGLSLSLKNSIDRGIYVSNGSEFVSRLEKELKRRFPDHPYMLLLEHRSFLTEFLGEEVSDPLFNIKTSSRASTWRPFLSTPDSEIIEVLYPLPGLNTTCVVVSREPLPLKSHSISPVILSGVLRSLYDYDMTLKGFHLESYEVFRAIKNRLFQPPYLVLDYSDDEYSAILERGLESGVLLNERSPLIILPPDYSKGETSKVLQLFQGVSNV